MISFFWRKGFYFNSRIYFYTDHNFFYFITKLFGFNTFFVYLFLLRLEHFSASKSMIRFWDRAISKKEIIFAEQSLEFLYMLNYYLIITFPVLLNMEFQFKLNILIYYLTRTYKGFSLYVNRPLKRRSWGRTFRGKPNKHFKISDYWL